MSQKLLSNASFHALLNQMDQEIVKRVQEARCQLCTGPLHRADYPRSPMGVPSEFRENYDERCSLCCATCRKRTTSSSVRFLGRRWYPAPFLMLISILSLGITKRRLRQIKDHFGLVVSESTWRRWRKWWRDIFVKTPFWQQAKGRAPPTPDMMTGPFPRVLFDALHGNLQDRMVLLLRFFAPLTAGNLRAV